MNATKTTQRYLIPCSVEFSRDDRYIDGTVPTIRTKNMDIIFASVGATEAETSAARDEVLELLKLSPGAAARLSALEARNKELTEALRKLTEASVTPDEPPSLRVS